MSNIFLRMVLALAGVAVAIPFAALAQDFPQKPVTIIAAYPAGGDADQMAWVLAGELSKRLGQQVTVENWMGASGMIGTNSIDWFL